MRRSPRERRCHRASSRLREPRGRGRRGRRLAREQARRRRPARTRPARCRAPARARLRFDPGLGGAGSARCDEHTWRLVVRRGLYDHGTLVQSAASLAPLARAQELRLAPQAMRQLGVEPGDEVRVRSPRGELVVAAVGDAGVPERRGSPSVQRRPRRRDERLRAHRLLCSGGRGRRGEGELMPDPLFAHGVDLGAVIIVAVKVLVAFGVLLVSVMLTIWFERKVISDMQNRIGPNRAGPYGILQTLADGIKLFFKEDLLPDQADRFVFRLAPYLALLPALLIFTIVPVGGVVTIAHHVVELQVADPPIGILFLLALSSVSVYGTMLAGWSSGSKYPLLGSIRASAQMISYEAAMGLTIAMVVIVTHSLSTRAIVDSQAASFFHWNIFRLGILPFPLFLGGRDGRAQPPALRPDRGRAGARGRVPHRVLVAALRPVLPGRVHEHDHDVGRDGDAVLRWPGRPRLPLRALAVADPVVRRQDRRVHVRLRLDPCRPAPAPLRPAHGARLEGPHPALARMAAGRGGLPGRDGLGRRGLLRLCRRGERLLAGGPRRAWRAARRSSRARPDGAAAAADSYLRAVPEPDGGG